MSVTGVPTATSERWMRILSFTTGVGDLVKFGAPTAPKLHEMGGVA
jgi:hypothetical protein